MRKILWLSALALSASTSASAQSSQCQWIGNVWTCQQQPGIDWNQNRPNYDAMGDGVEQMGSALRAMREREAREDRQQALSQSRQQVGALIRAGRCREAANIALANSDFEMARNARDLCVPTP